jgi:hypothetical protein
VTRTRPRLLTIATLVFVLAAVAACGSGSGPSLSARASNPSGATTGAQPGAVTAAPSATGAASAATAAAPCGLITDAEAGTLLGGPAAHKDGGSRDASNGSGVVVTENRCEWNLITSDQLGHDLWVAVYAGADRTYFDDAVTHETAIPGLGDAATGSSNHVWVISKGTVLQVYGSLPASNGLQQATAIAIAKL